MAFEFSRFNGILAQSSSMRESKWLPLGSGASYVTSPDFKNSQDVSKCLFLPQPDCPADFILPEDLETESAEEIAASIAEFCIREDNPKVISKPSMESGIAIHKSQVNESKGEQLIRNDSMNSCGSPKSSSNFGSGDLSPRGSPTSVLGEAGSRAWDILFAAAERIQKLASTENVSNKEVLSKDIQELISVCKKKLQLEASVPASFSPPAIVSPKIEPSVIPPMAPVFTEDARMFSEAFQRQQFLTQQQQEQNLWIQQQHYQQQAWLQSQYQLMHAMQNLQVQSQQVVQQNRLYPQSVNNFFNPIPQAPCPSPPQTPQTKPKNKQSGTGVFLPMNASSTISKPSQSSPSPASRSSQSSSQSSQQSSSSKKPARSTTVIIPPRLVHSLGLQVDAENNVLLKKAGPHASASGSRRQNFAVKVGNQERGESKTPKPQPHRRNGAPASRKNENKTNFSQKMMKASTSSSLPDEWVY